MQGDNKVVSLEDYKNDKLSLEEKIKFIGKLKYFFKELLNRVINYLLIKKGRGPLTHNEDPSQVFKGTKISGTELEGIVMNLNPPEEFIEAAKGTLNAPPMKEGSSFQGESMGGIARVKRNPTVMPFTGKGEQSTDNIQFQDLRITGIDNNN